jgi:lipopolysaccharide biosynthesis glycosyltransferase
MKIYIGYDDQFEENIDVQIHSLLKHSSIKLDIHLLKIKELTHLLWRKKEKKQTTDSAFTRWLVPYLSDYKGWSLYMDSDMFCRNNIEEVFNLKDENKSVMVVKNNFFHEQKKKFNNKIQSNYSRKNWSSFILFNNSKCKVLDLEYVNKAKGLELHQFKWLNDEQIGELPKEWNYLVEIDHSKIKVKNVHWTLGGPWFKTKECVEYCEEWKETKLYLQKNLPNQN